MFFLCRPALLLLLLLASCLLLLLLLHAEHFRHLTVMAVYRGLITISSSSSMKKIVKGEKHQPDGQAGQGT